MKQIFTILIVLLLSYAGRSQQVYNPKADARQDMKDAIEKADTEGKHVFVMVGGNWCPWCRQLNKLLSTNQDLNALLKKNYVLVKVNYSKENKNKAVLKRLDYPQRFGFPVIVILSATGERIHTQNTVYLEKGDGYSNKRIKEFLNNWSPKALDPDQYD